MLEKVLAWRSSSAVPQARSRDTELSLSHSTAAPRDRALIHSLIYSSLEMS